MLVIERLVMETTITENTASAIRNFLGKVNVVTGAGVTGAAAAIVVGAYFWYTHTQLIENELVQKIQEPIPAVEAASLVDYQERSFLTKPFASIWFACEGKSVNRDMTGTYLTVGSTKYQSQNGVWVEVK